MDAEAFLTKWFALLERDGWGSTTFTDALSKDLVWTATGTSPIAGTYRGLDAYVSGVYRRLAERIDTWPTPHVERLTARDEWGVVEFSSTGGRGKNGADYKMRYCWVVRVQNDLITEVTGYHDSVTVVALFADEHD